jgi:hypothetical protein
MKTGSSNEQTEGVNRRCLKRLVRRIRASLAKRETRIIPRKEWEGAKARDLEQDGDVVSRIAEAAKCDWLLDGETGDARFFEGV